jgi:hypothetical protein
MAVALEPRFEAELAEQRSETGRQGLTHLQPRRGVGFEHRHAHAAAGGDQRGYCSGGATAHDRDVRRAVHVTARLAGRPGGVGERFRPAPRLFRPRDRR